MAGQRVRWPGSPHTGRGRRQRQLDELVAGWTRTLDADDLLDLLHEAGVPAGLTYTAADMVDDPRFRARQAIVRLDRLGSFPMQTVAPGLSGTPGEVRWLGPELGKHNEEIYGGLIGVAGEQRGQWAARGTSEERGPMGKLDGKNVVITGATGGQGQAACRLFCEEGGRVLGTDLDEQAGTQLAEELRGKGYDFAFVAADLSGSAGCERFAGEVGARFDQVDVLYNNHGIILGKPLLETTEQEWDLVHDVDLKSVFLLTKQIAPLMLDHGGSIINVSSVGGLVAFENMAAYGAAKGGLAMFSKAAAVDLAPYGVRVNAICPGVVDTPMPRNFISGLAEKDAIWQGFEDGHLVGRLGRSEEIVSLALYLASDDSTFMTGAAIPIDGGWSVR